MSGLYIYFVYEGKFFTVVGVIIKKKKKKNFTFVMRVNCDQY